MSKTNTRTEKGRRIHKLLDRAKYSLGEADCNDIELWHAVNDLHEAIELLINNDKPCWELRDTDEVIAEGGEEEDV